MALFPFKGEPYLEIFSILNKVPQVPHYLADIEKGVAKTILSGGILTLEALKIVYIKSLICCNTALTYCILRLTIFSVTIFVTSYFKLSDFRAHF